MTRSERGFTLVEALLATVMVAIVIGALAYMFQVTVAGWSTQGGRAGLGVNVGKAVEVIARDLRNAKTAASPFPGEVRFTTDDITYYSYYLYNAGDSYPPQFGEPLYQIKKAVLSDGIDGTFTYGSGDIIATGILPPPSSTLSYDGATVTIDLAGERGESTIRSATKVTPRNI